MQGQTKITNAFQLGLLGGLGVLTAVLIGGAVETLANIITYVAAAIFIALGLDPVVSKLESFNLKRPVAILVVVLVLLGGLTTLFWAILPTLASQGAHFIATAPAVISGFGQLPFVIRLDDQLGGAISNAIASASSFLSDSANWPKMLGGVVQVGVNIFNGFFAGIVILILSLYFMASLNRFKSFIYSLVPATKREKFHDIAEQVATSVGRYVIGQFSIALINAVLSYVFMSITGIPFAVVLAFIILLLGLIPLVGTVTGAAIVALVALSVYALRRVLMSPLGYTLRASRDSVGRAEAMGLNVAQVQWLGFVIAAGAAGLAGALFAFSKGSISPDVLGVSKSVDGLVMVMLGGVHTLVGPLVGAVTFTALQDSLARSTDYWRAVLGGSMLLMVLVFPQGIAGSVQALWQRVRGASA